MPELPEVETVVRELRRPLKGARITGVRVRWAKTVLPLTPQRFRRLACGQTIHSITRRAKYIVLALDSGWRMLVHLRMTGQLYLTAAATPQDPHDRLVIALSGRRELRLHDPRKFGRVWLTPDGEQALAHLGPEPLSAQFTAPVLFNILQASSRRIKPLLLDQSVIAGLGNIYVDECLWQARIHPGAAARSVRRRQAGRLHRAIAGILQRAILRGGTSLGEGESNFLRPSRRRGGYNRALRAYQQQGRPCARCGTPIARLVLAQRGTHYCPRCQPLWPKQARQQEHPKNQVQLRRQENRPP